MNTRIRELRNALNLTQTEFGKIIGLKPSSISDIEKGRCNVTERLFIAICAKFSVNEKWLKYGEGEMFLIEDKQFNEFFEIYKTLKPPLQDFLIQIAENLRKTQDQL